MTFANFSIQNFLTRLGGFSFKTIDFLVYLQKDVFQYQKQCTQNVCLLAKTNLQISYDLKWAYPAINWITKDQYTVLYTGYTLWFSKIGYRS